MSHQNYRHTKEARERMSEKAKASWADPEQRAKRMKSILAAHSDPEYLKRQSETSSELWADPGYRARVRAGIARRKAERDTAKKT